MTYTLSEEIRIFLISEINSPSTGNSFALPEDFIKFLLEEFNLKIQKIDSGYICFHSYKVGSGSLGQSSGEALAKFLCLNKCVINPKDPDGSLTDFCQKAFVGA